MTASQPLLEGQVLTGSLFNEPMQVRDGSLPYGGNDA